jgi:hypothetical protein
MHERGTMDYPAQVYEELVDFIAANTAPENLIGFRVSEQTRQRVWELIDREKDDDLSPEETSELDHFMRLEHVMRLAKARVHRHVGA